MHPSGMQYGPERCTPPPEHGRYARRRSASFPVMTELALNESLGKVASQRDASPGKKTARPLRLHSGGMPDRQTVVLSSGEMRTLQPAEAPVARPGLPVTDNPVDRAD
jgi:hypothetical protein